LRQKLCHFMRFAKSNANFDTGEVRVNGHRC
jgi:hypothetical protein